MSTRPLLVRGLAIIILLTHVLIVISLFFPFAPFQKSVSTGWQWFLGPNEPGPLDLYSIASSDMLIMALALPSLASVVVFRSPTRMMGLLGVWISLPLTLFYYFVCVNTTIDYQGFLIGASPAVWFPPVGFALSFISCLALALYLPFLRAGAQERRAMHRPAHLEAGQHERAERVSYPDGGEPPAYVTRWSLRPSFAFIGLLCHLLIGLSLLFPYTELYDGYEGGLMARKTGWQLLGNALQSQTSTLESTFSVEALLLLAAMVLPALFYLACLLPFPHKSDQREALLFKGAYLSYLLNTMGFSLSLTALALSLLLSAFGGADLHNYSITGVAFAVPPAAFLISLLCSTVLLDSRLRQRQARERRS